MINSDQLSFYGLHWAFKENECFSSNKKCLVNSLFYKIFVNTIHIKICSQKPQQQFSTPKLGVYCSKNVLIPSIPTEHTRDREQAWLFVAMVLQGFVRGGGVQMTTFTYVNIIKKSHGKHSKYSNNKSCFFSLLSKVQFKPRSLEFRRLLFYVAILSFGYT